MFFKNLFNSLNYLPTLRVSVLKYSSRRMSYQMKLKRKESFKTLFSLVVFSFKFFPKALPFHD